MALKGFVDYLLKWRTTRTNDRLIEDKPPTPVIIVGANDGAEAAPPMVNAAGEVTEASGAAILADTSGLVTLATRLQVLDNNRAPLTWQADGTRVSNTDGQAWIPFVPVTVTADGAGLPPATAIIPLVAALNLDVMIWMQVDTVAGANQYQFDFRTDPLAAVGGIVVVDPDWTAIELPLPANGVTPSNTYGHRMMTTAVANAFGIAQGANGDWPNGAQVTFYGFYRAVG